jgi:peptidylprolyl isomerase/peptidyl-prolyl cis-trans isomerase B (cyclophilin B)
MKRILLFFYSMILVACSASADDKETKVQIVTDLGKITVKLYNETPQHRDNFLKLVQEHKYDSLLFHRVIKQFMIQAGDINSKNAPGEMKLGDGDLDYKVPAEIVYPKYFHKAGALCAARQGDNVNPARESSATQFYIVTGKHFTDHDLDKMEQSRGIKFTPEQREAYKIEGGAPHLDGSYTVFGEVVKGMKVVRKIELVETDVNDRPIKNIKIKKVKILK